MRKIVFGLLIVLWLNVGNTHEPELAEIMSNVLPSVAYIQVEQFAIRDKVDEVTKEVTQVRVAGTPIVGTGFVIDGSTVVTNYHVISFAITNNTDIYVSFRESNRRYQAKILGYDKVADVALLGLSETFPSVKISKNTNLRMGDAVFSISHFYGIGWSGTQGTVSSNRRNDTRYPYVNNLQLQLLQGSGSSGGPVFNYMGEVVGLNRSIVSMYPRSAFEMSRGSSMLSMVGYPVRADTLLTAIEAIRRDIIVVHLDLGVTLIDFGSSSQYHLNYASGDPDFPVGTMVLGIDKGNMSTLMLSDIIISIDGEEFSSALELFEWLNSQRKFKAGDYINVQLYRNAEIINTTVKIQLAGL